MYYICCIIHLKKNILYTSVLSIMSIFPGFLVSTYVLTVFLVWDSDYLHTLRLLYVIELSSSAYS